jgi:hypothetical protein
MEGNFSSLGGNFSSFARNVSSFGRNFSSFARNVSSLGGNFSSWGGNVSWLGGNFSSRRGKVSTGRASQSAPPASASSCRTVLCGDGVALASGRWTSACSNSGRSFCTVRPAEAGRYTEARPRDRVVRGRGVREASTRGAEERVGRGVEKVRQRDFRAPSTMQHSRRAAPCAAPHPSERATSWPCFHRRRIDSRAYPPPRAAITHWRPP